jgi:putative hemolysin
LQWRETRFHVNRKVVLMNHRRSRFSASAAALSTALLVGCGSSDPRPTTTTTSAIANPASVFCVSQGGKVEIVDEAGGQVGYCDLPGGTRVEEWAYFRSQTGTTSVP